MVARGAPVTLRGLLGLKLIHFARWVLIRRNQWPDLGQGSQALDNDYMLFLSNFNGTWDQYIDAFSEVVPLRMKAIWGTSYGFPGPEPVEPFKEYIRRNEYVANHYWSAYSGFTTTEIISAGHVERALEAFRAHTAELEPAAFRTAYESLLTTIQHDL